MTREEFINLIGQDLVVDYPFGNELQQQSMKNFYIDNEGKVTVALSDEGSTVDDMLRYVLLDPSKLLHEFSAEVISNHNNLDEKTQRAFIEEFKAGLYGYTYLEEE